VYSGWLRTVCIDGTASNQQPKETLALVFNFVGNSSHSCTLSLLARCNSWKQTMHFLWAKVVIVLLVKLPHSPYKQTMATLADRKCIVCCQLSCKASKFGHKKTIPTPVAIPAHHRQNSAWTARCLTCKALFHCFPDQKSRSCYCPYQMKCCDPPPTTTPTSAQCHCL